MLQTIALLLVFILTTTCQAYSANAEEKRCNRPVCSQYAQLALHVMIARQHEPHINDFMREDYAFTLLNPQSLQVLVMFKAYSYPFHADEEKKIWETKRFVLKELCECLGNPTRYRFETGGYCN